MLLHIVSPHGASTVKLEPRRFQVTVTSTGPELNKALQKYEGEEGLPPEYEFVGTSSVGPVTVHEFKKFRDNTYCLLMVSVLDAKFEATFAGR